MNNQSMLRFVYRNYKDEIEERTIQPDMINTVVFFQPAPNDEFHPEGGWMISGICQKRNQRRTFELRRIVGPITEVLGK